MSKTCCCTGHRPKGFPFRYGEDEQKHDAYLRALRQRVEFVVTQYGVTHFISGMAIGVDMDFAEIVIELRSRFSVTLECAIPCANQTLKWSDKEKSRYTEILSQADEVNFI